MPNPRWLSPQAEREAHRDALLEESFGPLDDGLPEMISTGEAGTLESRPVCELFLDELPD